jgi:hypothetical protein
MQNIRNKGMSKKTGILSRNEEWKRGEEKKKIK